MTEHSPATRRERQLPVMKSGDAIPDQGRLPPEVSSCPPTLRRAWLFRARQKSFAAELSPRAQQPLANAAPVRRVAALPPENQERRCRQKAFGRHSLTLSFQHVAPASRRLSRGRLALAANTTNKGPTQSVPLLLRMLQSPIVPAYAAGANAAAPLQFAIRPEVAHEPAMFRF